MHKNAQQVRFPRAEPPGFGEMVEIAPGVLWLRLPLPYALNHVNVYLLEDHGGWAVFDTGICDEPTLTLWPEIISQALGGRPVVKLIVSHYHPDHAGMAGWLHERYGAPLWMPQTEYLYSRLLQSLPATARLEDPPFYRALGLDSAQISQMLNRGKSYLERMSGLPHAYHRLLDGESIEIGGRQLRIVTGGGHAPEQAMLWCPADQLFIAADQVLARISPNVSVVEMEPAADPLGLYLRSLERLHQEIDERALVLPGHNLPFHGLHGRMTELAHHHEQRCATVLQACRDRALSAAELVPILFPRRMDAHQMGFALGEALAHINYLVRRAELTISRQQTGHPTLYLTAGAG